MILYFMRVCDEICDTVMHMTRLLQQMPQSQAQHGMGREPASALQRHVVNARLATTRTCAEQPLLRHIASVDRRAQGPSEGALTMLACAG